MRTLGYLFVNKMILIVKHIILLTQSSLTYVMEAYFHVFLTLVLNIKLLFMVIDVTA